MRPEPRTPSRRARIWPATSSPPSVVTSWRDSGTRQQSWGLTPGGDPDHLVGHRHLEIHPGLEQLAHQRHIAVLDVAPILAQMQRDAVGARLLRQQRGVDGIGIIDAPRLAERRDVIDVDAQGDARDAAAAVDEAAMERAVMERAAAWPASLRGISAPVRRDRRRGPPAARASRP